MHANRQWCCCKDAGAASTIIKTSPASQLFWPNHLTSACADIIATYWSKDLMIRVSTLQGTLFR
jgi:hypothetical protein